MQTLLSTTLARAEISVKLSLQSKLRAPLCRSTEQSLSMTNDVRAKAIVSSEVSLFNKFEQSLSMTNDVRAKAIVSFEVSLFNKFRTITALKA